MPSHAQQLSLLDLQKETTIPIVLNNFPRLSRLKCIGSNHCHTFFVGLHHDLSGLVAAETH